MFTRRTGSRQTSALVQQRLARVEQELAAARARRAAGLADPAHHGADPGGQPAGLGDPLEGETGDVGPADVPVEGQSPPASAEAGPHGPAAASVPGRHARRVPAPSSLAGWASDRLPPTLQGRVRLLPVHLTVVALAVALAVAGSAWWVLGTGATATVAPPATWATPDDPKASTSALVPWPTPGTTAASVSPGDPSAAPGVGASAVPVGGSGSPTEVVVDVAGKVRRPGIVRLPAGARVVDALEAAGGARPQADLTSVNLARLVVDGEQILVGVPPADGVAAAAAAQPPATLPGSPGPGTLVNLNTADQSQLETLPGVGPVTAMAILQWRADNGAFTAVDELLEVSGIGEATLAKVAPFVTL